MVIPWVPQTFGHLAAKHEFRMVQTLDEAMAVVDHMLSETERA